MSTARLIGALALAAALAMGAVPAFAATDTSGNAYDARDIDPNQFAYENDDPSAGKAGATTRTYVFYKHDQILATIPLEVTVIATGDMSKAGEVIGPTNYRIENHSVVSPIYVNSFKVTENTANQKWTCGTITVGSGATDSATPSGDLGVLDLTLTSSKDESATVTFTAAKNAPDGVGLSSASGKDESWKVPSTSNGETGTLNMVIDGKSLRRSGVTLEADNKTSIADNAFTLKFVVGLSAA